VVNGQDLFAKKRCAWKEGTGHEQFEKMERSLKTFAGKSRLQVLDCIQKEISNPSEKSKKLTSVHQPSISICAFFRRRKSSEKSLLNRGRTTRHSLPNGEQCKKTVDYDSEILSKALGLSQLNSFGFSF
jgi:hypothetical protein